VKIGVFGNEETGKTRFCMTARPPVYILETERGAHQLAKLFPKKDINILNCYVSTGDAQQDCLASLDLMKEAIEALSDLEEGTICIDSGTDIWEWVQGVLRLEVLKVDLAAKVQPSDYKWANAEYRSIIMKCRAIPTHFILTARRREVFQDARLTPTGVYKAQWQKWTPHWIDVQICLYKDRTKQGVIRRAVIEKFRHADLKNRDITDIDFDKVYEILKPYLPGN